MQTVMIHSNVSREVYNIVCEVADHCPRLWSMLHKGTKEGKHNEALFKPYTTKVYVDTVLRFWRYADFELDYMLAQQFNYEYKILNEARRSECKHIVKLDDEFLNKDCAVFELKRYQMDLRTYLRKHRDYRKLNEILL